MADEKKTTRKTKAEETEAVAPAEEKPKRARTKTAEDAAEEKPKRAPRKKVEEAEPGEAPVAVEEPLAEEAPPAEEPAPAEEPVAAASAAEEPVADELPDTEPATDEAATEQPSPEDAATEQPSPEDAATEQPTGPQRGPKKKSKRLPRAQRHRHVRPKRERPGTRKPITRLPKPQAERGRSQQRRGVVVSAAMDKTIVVRVDSVKAHPKYKKVIRRSVKFHAHDEQNQAKAGDVVRIVETRPLSKAKRWRLAEIVEVAK
jgi:small subunit ribosomal protein S17